MKLIIATGIFPPDIGGPATYSKKIAEEFSRRGWDVKVLTYAGIYTNQHETEHEVTRNFVSPQVMRISREHNVFARYFLYTWNLIKLARKADLIYAQGPVSEGLPAYFASKITGKKYVLKIVGDPAWERLLTKKQKNNKIRPACAGRKQKNGNCLPAEDSAQAEKLEIRNYDTGFIGLDKFQDMNYLPLKIKILRWVEKIVAKNADTIITPSEYLKKIVMMWGVDSGKIQVVYNAVEDVNTRLNTPLPAQAGLTPLKGGTKEDIILSVGRLVPWKGFDMLIDLMPDLLAVNPNFKLVIGGDGQEYGKLKEKINFINIKKDPSTAVGMTLENAVGMTDDRIILTGKLEHNEVLKLMQSANMFVLNSGYEGLPHSVIEAMQAGIPCAVSNIGGNPELVKNEKTGLLFAYNNKEQIKDAIIRLWQDDELRERVVNGGFEKVKEFSYERMIEETEKILNFKTIFNNKFLNL